MNALSIIAIAMSVIAIIYTSGTAIKNKRQNEIIELLEEMNRDANKRIDKLQGNSDAS